jgi:hypothetical protein
MMSRLDELKKDVANMDTDELLELVREIRKDRKVSKRPLRTQTKKTRESSKDKVKAMFAGLSPEEKKALLEKLGG